ncbi:MAG: SAM-dependent methyltransferase [Lysobacterales bacterium CG17_big_fil_post_rev_8_21_14_2_50_64_11]|nr:MAG: SAM-dependent methyltransferase [Xanthomonadales bacterium CG17_big_fil_post_rev_8_21_14_2_50_64_11]PIX59872.1 MAG: SAM-dependent methyltransferase [Xanthomonadales bacterium CG_4_10_14_3_um_filter_64_11]
MTCGTHNYVPDTRFGLWFLRSRVWQQRVLRVAIADLLKLFDRAIPAAAVVLDVGCGQGGSLAPICEAFNPACIIGVDADTASLKRCRNEADRLGIEVKLIAGDCAAIGLPDASADMVFCHQTFHHLVDQEQALREFWRVLKPGGTLLFAESTKAYIDTWVIRWLFRHPMHVQKSASQYLQMLRKQGFIFSDRNVSFPYLWWSRAKDFGLLERIGLGVPPPRGQREETLVNAVVQKPLAAARC